MNNFFFEELQDDNGSPPRDSTENTRKILSPSELDTYIDDLLDQPDLEITPPDALVSATYQWTGNDINQIRAMADSLPASVVRAKGFIEADGSMCIFSYVMGDWTLEESKIPVTRIKHKNIVVFIGPIDSMEGIRRAAETGNWSQGEVFRPKS